MDLLFLKPRKSDEAGPWEHCPGAHTRTAFAGFCVDRVHVYKPKCSYYNCPYMYMYNNNNNMGHYNLFFYKSIHMGQFP